jgi:hypothetical protein
MALLIERPPLRIHAEGVAHPRRKENSDDCSWSGASGRGIRHGIPVLVTIGGILLVIGVILWIFGTTGCAVGGRKHYY